MRQAMLFALAIAIAGAGSAQSQSQPQSKKELVAKLLQLQQAGIENVGRQIAAVYEERFSEEELKAVVAWLESPVSKKMQQMDSENASALAQQVVADTRTMVEPKLKALDLALGKRLGVSPASGAAAASAPKK